MSGFFLGDRDWFSRQESEVSAHFGVGLRGQIDQYVQLQDTAWANGVLQAGNIWPGNKQYPNADSVSIETEDLNNGATPVSAAQYAAVQTLVRYIVSVYPSIRWLCSHRSISPIDRPNCPGPRWINSGKFDALAKATGLIAVK